MSRSLNENQSVEDAGLGTDDRMTRLFDILLAGIALLVLSPILLIVVVFLRLSGEREVFFCQQRVGRGGQLFGLLKFATMLKNSPNMSGGVLTLKDDPRILPFGRFLRRTKLNELPQLLNVLRGDMSLVGPRPQAPPHFQVYSLQIREVLATVRPGLSGIGSIVFRDEENILERADDKACFYGNVIAPYKGRIECWYIQHRGPVLYLQLIGLTVWSVFFADSRLHRRIFSDLPAPPPELAGI